PCLPVGRELFARVKEELDMATKKVRMFEFVEPSKALKAQEVAINQALQEHFPQVGPVSLIETQDGEIAVKMTLLVGPGHKGKLDEAYRFVMNKLGEARGRKPGEKRVPVKYYLPAELHH